MSDCLFCRIVQNEIPTPKILDDDDLVAFEDINPQAPVHLLVVPKKHIATLNDLGPGDDVVLGRMQKAAVQLAHDRDIADPGYRLVLNCNADAGQSVWHIHLHLLGGRRMLWPPG